MGTRLHVHIVHHCFYRSVIVIDTGDQEYIRGDPLRTMCVCLFVFFPLPDDFKPQSVDSTKPGQLKVTDDEVNVSLPIQGQVGTV